MKRTINIIIMLLMIQYAKAQTCSPITNPPIGQYCEEGHSISTKPSNPVNNECPNLENNFDWRVKHAPGGNVPDEYYFVYGPNASANPVWVRSPFNGPTDATYYPYVTANHGSNFQPEDGWELLKVEFGSAGNIGLAHDQAPGPNNISNIRPKLPYMMLYNKYSGTLRFFGALLEPDNTYETVKIELRIPSQSPDNGNGTYINTYQDDLKVTNLLSIQGESVQPLDQETDETALNVFVKYTNNPNVFFWFDIPVAYDPCLCNNRAQLDVSFSFVQTADIDITGSITGSIKTEKKGQQDYAKMVFGRVLAAGISTAVAIKTGGAVINFSAFTDLVDIAIQHPSLANDQTAKDNLTTLKNFLSCTEKIATVVKGNYSDVNNKDETKRMIAGQKILDANTTYLSSLVKGCGTDNAATVISGQVIASGTYSLANEIQGSMISLALPGANWSDKTMQSNNYTDGNGKVIPAYPTYNERLGTFAMLETPAFGVFNWNNQCMAYDGYPNDIHRYTKAYTLKLASPIKYTFNPLLNLDKDKTVIEARVVFTINDGTLANYRSVNTILYNCSNDQSIPTPINISYNGNNKYRYVTPFVPLDNLAGLPIRFDLYGEDSYGNGTGWPNVGDVEAKTFLQFKILGVSKNTGTNNQPNSFYQIFTFPVDLQDLSSDPYQSINNTLQNYATGIKEYNTVVSFGNDADLYFEGPVLITAKLSTTPGKKVRIFSIRGFELMPGAEISPDIELIHGTNLAKIPQPEQTHLEVSSFCTNTNKYKAQTFSAAAIQTEKNEYDNRVQSRLEQIKNAQQKQGSIDLKLSPNPANNYVHIEFELPQPENVQISIINSMGKSIKAQKGAGNIGLNSTDLDISDLSAGTYYINFISDRYFNSKKLIIVR